MRVVELLVCNESSSSDVQNEGPIANMSEYDQKTSKPGVHASVFADRYLNALLDGNAEMAAAVVDNAINEGLTHCSIYMQVFAPALDKLGELWQKRRISVATEHLGTQITFQQLDRLRSGSKCKPRIGLKSVVTTPEGDLHTVGARMVADFLKVDGWDVDFLGASVPANDLVEFVKNRKIDLVVFSIKLPECIETLNITIGLIRKSNPQAKIAVGGTAVTKKSGQIKADVVTSDALEALHRVRELFNVNFCSVSLNDFLQRLGKRIQQLRHKQGLSQSELAELAGLDRTYISSVEHGKQNVSIAAILKIACAFDVSIESLLVEDIRAKK